MKLKNLIVTIACLAILSGVAYWLNRPPPPPPADPRVGQPLLSADLAGQVAKVHFSDQGKSIALTRQADGAWRVDSYFDLPADFDKLSRFVSDLTGAKLQRLVTTYPDRLARLEFKDTKIELFDAAGRPLWSVVLGKSADSGGRFVRFGDEQKAYLTDLNAWLDTEAKNWADAQLVNLKPDDIARVDIPFEHGPTVVATRAKPGDPWTSAQAPAGQRLSADKMTSLLATLTAVRFSDTSDLGDPQAAAARAHPRDFQLAQFNGATFTIALGRKPEEKKLKPVAPEPAASLPKSTDKNAKPAAPPSPEYDTIPAGPVYAFITSSEARAPVNALMKRRAFQVEDYVFTGLPQQPSDLFEPVPPPAKPAETPKSP